MALAVNGPLTVRELGRVTNIEAHKIWDIIERLREKGIVVKRDVAGGRKYVSLNRRLPIYRALLRLLNALDERWPAERMRLYVARKRMPFDGHLTTAHLDHLFQSPVRSRTLLFIAACGETDLTSIYTILGLGATSAWLAVNHWENQAVTRSRRFKRHRLISLNPKFVVADELRALLRAIIAASPEYDDLRGASRRKQRAVLKSAGAHIGIPKRTAS